ncbi:uncharacterized protein METZ01_LOCUS294780 [marine metagenome]|uniref:Uncharacterized protein n=1 Tax=marine metagenome TaxID=408172 RepID=A0A382LZ87_9ZZZZ
MIAGNIPLELRLPEIYARRRHGRTRATFVPMPKTSIHKYYASMLRQNNVRSSRQVFLMDFKAKSESMKV